MEGVLWRIKKNQVLVSYLQGIFLDTNPNTSRFSLGESGILQNVPINLLLSQDTKRGSSTVCLESSWKGSVTHTKEVGKDKREFLDYDAT